jgi:hypothetical protein
MLADGPYPPALKRRVGGDWGHLSNTQALELLSSVDRERLQALVIAHASEKNNSSDCIRAALEGGAPELLPKVVWASQEGSVPWFEIAAAPATVPVAETAALASGSSIHAY